MSPVLTEGGLAPALRRRKHFLVQTSRGVAPKNYERLTEGHSHFRTSVQLLVQTPTSVYERETVTSKNRDFFELFLRRRQSRGHGFYFLPQSSNSCLISSNARVV